MRLGTYLGIFGTLFGNALVAVVLFMITTGAAYHPPALLNGTDQTGALADKSREDVVETQPAGEEEGDALILDTSTNQDCAVSDGN